MFPPNSSKKYCMRYGVTWVDRISLAERELSLLLLKHFETLHDSDE